MNDKILFWLDGDLTNFGLANFLQEAYPSKFFAIVDITDRVKSFFKSQKLVKFEKTWYYHDHVLPKTKLDLDLLSQRIGIPEPKEITSSWRTDSSTIT